MSAPVPTKTVVRFEIAPGSIAWVLATLAGVWLFLQLRVIALVLVVALVFAGTLKPLAEWIGRRGLNRVHALMVLFAGLLLVTALLLFLTVPPLVEQVAQLVRDAPHYREQLIALLQRHDFTAPFARAVQDARLDEGFARIERYLLVTSPQALTAIGWGVTSLCLSFYFLADGKRTQGVLYAVVPRDYHMRVARILHNLETIVGGYMRGQVITSAAIGLFTFLLLTICKVPNALSLALFAAVTDVIPFVGGLLATGPATLSALSQGVPTGLVVLGLLLTYQEVENRILVPRIYGRALRLSPTMVLIALLAGGLLLGVVGALLALPIAAGLQMVLLELGVEMPGDDSADQSALARDARTEATYERMSAGATAPEAGQIASTLAHEIRTEDAELATAKKELASAGEAVAG